MAEPAEQPPPPPPRPFPLYKLLSWSPDADREETWLRRKTQSKMRRSKSVTDDDVDELKACIELGFGFDSPEADPRLYDTFPALSLYHAVNKRYSDSLSNSVASLCSSPASDSVSPSFQSSPAAIISHGENPQTVKARLKQWAQVVACSVRQY
ncbi:uncharacterized protein LOC111005768 [Momordica charantia]|uniref:Uncharacterized protein LOC111005768 n=1 Tax=Momordica charantia TaxID=3673 RepID=A0A6J1BU15_MOMCH|nr:uncharacterized protein LOC111005768 [Momordica charantia]